MRTRMFGGMLAGMAALGIGWLLGRSPLAKVEAAPPPPVQPKAAGDESEDSKRVVAYIYGNIPITRQELGEYLIARYGAEKLDLLVNKRIIEHACKQKGIEVDAGEVEADYAILLKNVGVSKKDFIDKVLKQYRKTEYEWKEDVIRPRLLLTKLCKDRVQVNEEDLRKTFETLYGEKVDIQIILYPQNQQRYLAQLYDKVRQSEEAFSEEAKKQPDPNLAMTAGRIKPIAKFSGLEDIEKVAFSLKPGQVSHVMQVPEGWLIMRCLGRIPPDNAVKFEDKRAELQREVMDRKIQQEIPKAFAELAKEAAPNRLLTQQRLSRDEQEREIQQMLQKPGLPH
jgi:PPIC-type peptidyl-prolyl cis-trans isomerase-like protein